MYKYGEHGLQGTGELACRCGMRGGIGEGPSTNKALLLGLVLVVLLSSTACEGFAFAWDACKTGTGDKAWKCAVHVSREFAKLKIASTT